LWLYMGLAPVGMCFTLRGESCPPRASCPNDQVHVIAYMLTIMSSQLASSILDRMTMAIYIFKIVIIKLFFPIYIRRDSS